MLANMAASLIMHKRIHTTVAKAKALRVYVEPLLTKSKEDNTHSRRVVFSYLQNKDAVTELFREISVKIAERPGGYTRIIKTGARLGDNAEMCMIELVDYNENLLTEKGAAQKSTRRRRRGGAKKEETAAAPASTEAKAEVATEDAEKPQAVVEEKAEATPEAKEKVIADASDADATEKAEKPQAATEAEKPKEETVAEAELKEEKPAEEPEAKTEASAESEAKVDETADEKAEEAPKAEDTKEEESNDKKDEAAK